MAATDKQAALESSSKMVETKAPPTPREREPIPVKVLRFRHGETVEIPGKPGASSVETVTHGAKSWIVEYLPWMRHHRVTFKEHEKATRVVHIHESWGTWEAP